MNGDITLAVPCRCQRASKVISRFIVFAVHSALATAATISTMSNTRRLAISNRLCGHMVWTCGREIRLVEILSRVESLPLASLKQ